MDLAFSQCSLLLHSPLFESRPCPLNQETDLPTLNTCLLLLYLQLCRVFPEQVSEFFLLTQSLEVSNGVDTEI